MEFGALLRFGRKIPDSSIQVYPFGTRNFPASTRTHKPPHVLRGSYGPSNKGNLNILLKSPDWVGSARWCKHGNEPLFEGCCKDPATRVEQKSPLRHEPLAPLHHCRLRLLVANSSLLRGNLPHTQNMSEVHELPQASKLDLCAEQNFTTLPGGQSLVVTLVVVVFHLFHKSQIWWFSLYPETTPLASGSSGQAASSQSQPHPPRYGQSVSLNLFGLERPGALG